MISPDPGSAQDRLIGCLVGLAVGDAVGTTLEFRSPGNFKPIDDMVGGGPFRLSRGQWTDDTSMALCLAESLVECSGFDPVDQLKRYVRWRNDGHLSCTGKCFDIGGTVRSALARFERTGDPWSGPTGEYSAGNGSLMRLAPVPMFYAHSPTKAIHMAAESSRTTHGAAAAVDACRYFAALLIGAINGESKENILADRYSPPPAFWRANPLVSTIDEIAGGSFKRREPPEIQGTGYVVKSLEAALWAFHKSTTFRDGCLLAANLGDDADTTAAIYGQIAGAHYGFCGIPEQWRNQLAMKDLIVDLALKLQQIGEVNGAALT